MRRKPRYLRCPEDVLSWIRLYENGADATKGAAGEVAGAGTGIGVVERAAVDVHARGSADCRAELAMLAGEPIENDHELPDVDRLFARIVARIAQSETVDRHDR